MISTRTPGATAPFPQEFLNKLETLRLEARRRYIGARKGSHLSPRRGTSLEFDDFRVYAPGDDPRWVDWGLYARTGRLYVKVFQEEEDLYVYVYVDASASMAVSGTDPTYRAATELALALSYVILSSEDSVRLHRLSAPDPQSTPFYRGRRRLLEAQEFLGRAAPRGRVRLPAALAPSLRAIRRPGKAILISDLLFPLEELRAGLDLLRAANLDVLVIHILGADELSPPLGGPERLVDSETGEEIDVRLDESARAIYVANLERHRREVKSLCHRFAVQYAFFDASTDLQDFVLTGLPALGLFR
ncbi:MAG: DUF58 domain-containing protein [Candidatus Binatia bacterium]